MRNTFGFAQIAQKNCVKLLSFHAQKFAKNISGFAKFAQKKLRKTAQNSLRFKRKSSQKKNLRENSANFAQKI